MVKICHKRLKDEKRPSSEFENRPGWFRAVHSLVENLLRRIGDVIK